MIKALRMAALCGAAALVSVPAMADEGMWTLYDLPQAAYQQMQAEGIKMSYDDLYKSDKALKNAVVDFCDFCSGVVVSPDGLLFTNHHCGFGFINQLSTLEHDYMRDGFVSNSFEEELPAEGAFVKFMVKQEDVTKRFDEAGYDKMKSDQKGGFIAELEKQMTDEARKIDPTYEVSIDAFFEGNQWIATTYQQFDDIRLVFTAPKSMGKFGGETDNWMWPRQTCDFSVFRIYADPKTNGPAKYSKDNVPYKAKRWSQVSVDGYKPGDYAMIMGYPGSTSRYISSYGIIQRHDIQNATMIDCRKEALDILRPAMASDQELRIKYENKFASIANYYKNSQGMNKCIDSIGLLKQKVEMEAAIAKMQKETGYLKKELSLPKLAKLYKQAAPVTKAWWYYRETLRGRFADVDSTMDVDVEKKLAVALCRKYYTSVEKKYQPKFLVEAAKKYGDDFTAYVDAVYNDGEMKAQLQKDIRDFGSKIRQQLQAVNNKIGAQEKLLTAAKLRLEIDKPHYSDANFTMRLTYGQVGEYMLGGRPSGYYTTAESLVEKMKQGDKIDDYKVQPELIDLMSQPDFGRYTDKTTGKMQLCFLTNNDITGGNSGSPVFGDRGQLLGLAFDGNWDSLASDILFDSVLARTICVDSRYILYLIDKWGHCDRLVKELGVK